MPEPLRRVIGILLILVAIGVTSWQSLLVSCSSASAGSAPDRVIAPG